MEAFENLRSRDHFETLGLTESATDSQLKEAYFRLAKRFHPDTHHDPALADLHDQIEAVFIRLGEAYEVLRNPRMRAAYEEALRSRRPRPEPQAAAPSGAGSTSASHAAAPASPVGPTSGATTGSGPSGASSASSGASTASNEAAAAEERKRIASEAVLKGSSLFEAGRYWDAIQTLEPAIPRTEGRVRSRARVILARCFLKNPHWVRRGEELLLDVTRDDPKYADAWYSLALVYKERGLKARAVSMLHKVLELKPEHEDAAAILAELEPPPAEPTAEPGIMKRLFRKG
jgi:curved DNA-binding protein CbpA